MQNKVIVQKMMELQIDIDFDGSTLFVTWYGDHGCMAVLHGVLDRAQRRVAWDVACHADRKQVASTLVEDDPRRAMRIRTSENDRARVLPLAGR